MEDILDGITNYEFPVIVEFERDSLIELGATLFVTATLIFLSWFIIRKKLG